MRDIAQKDVLARASLLRLRRKLRKFRGAKQVQLCFEEIANALWMVESEVVEVAFPFLADMGAWGRLGPPALRPISLERRATKITSSPFGSGLRTLVFAAVPGEVPPAVSGRLDEIIRVTGRLK